MAKRSDGGKSRRTTGATLVGMVMGLAAAGEPAAGAPTELERRVEALRARRTSEAPAWERSVYSDGSAAFVSPRQVELGGTVTVALRMFADGPVTTVLLWTRPENREVLQPMQKVSTKGRYARYEASVVVEQPSLQYVFIIATKEHTYYYSQDGLRDLPPPSVFDFRLLAGFRRPDWCDDAVFYQIFVDRFCNGDEASDVKDGEYSYGGFATKQRTWTQKPLEWKDGGCLDFFGGDLQGVRQKLGYLEDFGVNALYLNPIFHAPSHHKFDCQDYMTVDPHFGGDEALADLTAAAHDRGTKVVIDISVNHTGTAHKWFNREGFYGTKTGAFHDPKSTEAKLYLKKAAADRKKGDDPFVRWLGVDSLVTLDYASKATRKTIYEDDDSVLQHWLKPPYSIDGWRFDVAFMMGRYKAANWQHEVWPAIRRVCKDVNPACYLVSEDWTDAAEFLQGDMFDAVMNYYGLARPLRRWCGLIDRYLEPFAKDVPAVADDADQLARALRQNLARLPHALWGLQMNLIGSHDWFRLHNAKGLDFGTYRGVVAIQFTFPGFPCVYYGDEVGLAGHVETVEGCRYPMEWRKKKWDDRHVELYKTLGTFRRSRPALRDGSYHELLIQGRVFAFARAGGGDVTLTVVNDEPAPRNLRLPVMLAGEAAGEGTVFDEIFRAHGSVVVRDGWVEVAVPAHGALVFGRRP